MPELSEEGDEAARAGRQRALRRPLLRVIGSARAVAFSMNVQMSGFPQLPLARDSKSAEYLEKSKQDELCPQRSECWIPKVKRRSLKETPT